MVFMKRSALIYIAGFFFILAGCQQAQEINSFEACVEAGNPILESYPRQCVADGVTFIEALEDTTEFFICVSQADVCTLHHDPVCAMVDNDILCVTTPCPSTDAVDYSNSCIACQEGAYGYYRGTCKEHRFVVCQDTATGADPKVYADDSGSICVDVCPGNYDAYTTQTGIEVCIKHYGRQEIMQWEACTHSTETCSCVKAYETTTGDTIDNARYRCVPKQYEERLLFRAGIDKLDTSGKQNVIIA